MKLKKRKLKFAAIFGVCWFALLVGVVDGVVGFQKVVGWFGSHARAEVALWLAVLVPTAAVYGWTRETGCFSATKDTKNTKGNGFSEKEFDQETEKNA